MTDCEILQLAHDAGFSAAAIIPTAEIVFDAAFRPYCEQNLCGQYGANYSCPPDCGPPEAMSARLLQHPRALVVQTKWQVDDWHDWAQIRHAKQSHNRAMLSMIDRLRQAGHSGLMCGASCCTLCERCAIRDHKPCAYPDRRFSCLSAYCIYVKKLADACNMEYTCADGSLALFGLYAF